MTTLPNVPDIPAGTVATSDDLNELASACSFLLGSAPGSNPVWYTSPTAGQSIGTSFGAVNWTTPVKDNDGVWNSANPGRITIQTPGFYSIDWGVSLPNGGSGFAVQAFAQVVTSAGNPYNPSVTIPFQFCSLSQVTSSGILVAHGGGLVPTPLVANDIIQVIAKVTTAATTITSPPSYFMGQWVSA